jgi:hypothetical protein
MKFVFKDKVPRKLKKKIKKRIFNMWYSPTFKGKNIIIEKPKRDGFMFTIEN